MQLGVASGVLPRAGGVPVSGVWYHRASSLIDGGEAGLRAGVGGVSIGRFGWANADGVVLNERTSEGDGAGLVVIQLGDWRSVFWDEESFTWKIRQGLPVTLLSGAPGIFIQLPDGGNWNQRVYANPLDGMPYAGYREGLEPTAWAVGSPVGPGGLAFLTTWNRPNE